MGTGQSQPSNAVYWDADANQYYTLNNGANAGFNNYFMGNPMFSGMAEGQRNYLGSVLGKSNNKSMVDTNTARAKAAYEAVLSNLSSSPAYNQSAIFPGLSSPSNTQASQSPMNMSGAGRFLSPAQGQSTGGGLGFNFNAPQSSSMQQPTQQPMRNNMPPANAYLNPANLTNGNLGYWSQYTNAGDDVWSKIMASAPNVSQRPAAQPNALAAILSQEMANASTTNT